MTDSYQPIYDAVRSRISNGDVGLVIREVAGQAFDISHQRAVIVEQALVAIYEMQRPSAVYRPTLRADGSQWCAIYGDDLATGVAGFGDTPDAAMLAFDMAWRAERTPQARLLAAAQPKEKADE